MFPTGAGPPWIVTDSAHLSYWQGQSLQALTTVDVEATDSPGFSRVQLVFDRTTPTGTREDVMVCSLNFAERASTAVSPLGTADKSAAETALNTWFTTYKATLAASITLREYRWYDYEPITTRPGPVDRTTASGVAGAGGAVRWPDQVSLNQTFKTASRKHWGRWYPPARAFSTTLDGTLGRAANAEVNAVQAALRLVFQATGSTGLMCPVVVSIGYRGVMGIRELQTDNVYDVIRSRRAKMSSFKATNTS